jgi:hypothetical protein
VPHADHLFRDGAGASEGPHGYDVLKEGMDARDPVRPLVPVKTPIFRNQKGLLQKQGNLVKGDTVMGVPAVRIGYAQWAPVPVHNLYFLHSGDIKVKGSRNG